MCGSYLWFKGSQQIGTVFLLWELELCPLLFTFLFCVFLVFCTGFFLNICVVFWIPRTLPLMLVLLYLVVKTWFLHMLHCLLSNIVFVSEFSIITISLAITHYVLALTLIRRLHRVLLKENKRYKNAVLPLHLFSGTMRW